jgi:hypothetical protein
MTKPNFSKIPKSEWTVRYESGLVRVESAYVWIADVPSDKRGANYQLVASDYYGAFLTDVWRMTNLATKKSKIYFGETAWMDARREASDLDFGAWSI